MGWLGLVVVASAHPRSRGEHSFEVFRSSLGAGSSPLARGTCTYRHKPMNRGRLIPARAGNIPALSLSTRSPPAHPRSRGEHSKLMPVVEHRVGSSPLARGTCRSDQMPTRSHRLIPARAGNIVRHPGRCRVHPAHPRSRGEHPLNRDMVYVLPGSSPLARGTCVISSNDGLWTRLIPARAGNI